MLAQEIEGSPSPPRAAGEGSHLETGVGSIAGTRPLISREGG